MSSRKGTLALGREGVGKRPDSVKTATAIAVPPPGVPARAAAEWVEYETADGVPYYHSLVTGATVWEKPRRFIRARDTGAAYVSRVSSREAAAGSTTTASTATGRGAGTGRGVPALLSSAEGALEVLALHDGGLELDAPAASSSGDAPATAATPGGEPCRTGAKAATTALLHSRQAPLASFSRSMQAWGDAFGSDSAGEHDPAQGRNGHATGHDRRRHERTRTARSRGPRGPRAVRGAPGRAPGGSPGFMPKPEEEPLGNARDGVDHGDVHVGGAGAVAGGANAPSTRWAAPRPAVRRAGKRTFPRNRLYQVMLCLADSLSVVEVMRCRAVCRSWARVAKRPHFWREMCLRAQAQHPCAPHSVVPHECGDERTWKQELAAMFAGIHKWNRGGAGTAASNFHVSVSVRFKPVDIDESVAAAAKRERLARQRARREAREARRAAAEKRKRAGRPRCPWDSGAPRFHDPAAARKKKEAAAAARAAEEESLPQDMLVDKAAWSRGVVATGYGGVASRRFTCFSRVFSDGHRQDAVFNAVGRPLVASLWNGFDTTLFVYGQTGSGKTYTIFGPPGCYSAAHVNERNPLRPVDVGNFRQWGLLPRVVDCILKHAAAEPSVHFNLQASAVEVYQGGLFDLLHYRRPVNLVDRDALHLTSKGGRRRRKKVLAARARGEEFETDGFELQGQTILAIHSLRDLIPLAMNVEASRVAGRTKMNARSSRSHAVIVLNLTQTHATTSRTMRSKMLLVDLAGSERLKKSGSEGVRAEEARQINGSLTSLGRCIRALADREPHVPFRDTTLTKLLSQSLGGNSRTGVVVTCAQEPSHAEETVATLRFGERTAMVQNRARRQAGDRDTMVEDTRAALRQARDTLESLARRGQGGRFGDGILKPARDNYTREVATQQRLTQQLEAAARAVTEAIGAAGGVRTGRAVAAAMAQQAQLQRQLVTVNATLKRLVRSGVWVRASDLFVQTQAQVAALEGQLRQLTITRVVARMRGADDAGVGGEAGAGTGGAGAGAGAGAAPVPGA